MTERRQPDLKSLRERVNARLKLVQQMHAVADNLNRSTLDAVRGAPVANAKAHLHGTSDQLALAEIRKIMTAMEHEGALPHLPPLLSEDEWAALLGPES